MRVPVTGYALAWDTNKNTGSIIIRLQNGEQKTMNPDNAGEFAAVAAILNESPVFLDTATGVILTGWEQTGGS